MRHLAHRADHKQSPFGDRRRTTRPTGYAASQRSRKRVEEVLGCAKSAVGQGKKRFRGLARVLFAFTLTVAAYNLIRLPQLPRLLETG